VFVLVSVLFGVVMVMTFVGMFALAGLGGGNHRRRKRDGGDREQKENFFHELVYVWLRFPGKNQG
jgi:hypothetical protein